MNKVSIWLSSKRAVGLLFRTLTNPNPMSIPVEAVCLLLALTVSLSPAGDKVTFPGSRRSLVDPSKRFSIECAKSADTSRRQFSLVFHDLKKGEQQNLLQFERSVEVDWSPDGNALAMTELVDRNITEIFIFTPDHPLTLLNVNNEILAATKELRSHAPFLFLYFRAIRWKNSKTLYVQVRGRGEEEAAEFGRCYDYVISGKIKQIPCDR
jgi:hypothetical protein